MKIYLLLKRNKKVTECLFWDKNHNKVGGGANKKEKIRNIGDC